MTTPATPLFVKTHDFTVWLVNHTQRFPKSLRHSYTLKLETAAFEFEEAILMANAARGRERHAWLVQAEPFAPGRVDVRERPGPTQLAALWRGST